MADTRVINGKTQYRWTSPSGDSWHTTPQPSPPMQGGYNPSVLLNPQQLAQPFNPPPAPPPPPPFDPQLKNIEDANNKAYDDATTGPGGLDVQEGQIRSDYGFEDASNPFSRAKLLQQAYDNRVRGTTNSMASQGQLYSGAYQNAENTNGTNYSQQYNSLRSEYDRALGDLKQRRLGLGNTRDINNLTAKATSIQNAASAPLDTSSVPPPGAGLAVAGSRPSLFAAPKPVKPPRPRVIRSTVVGRGPAMPR